MWADGGKYIKRTTEWCGGPLIEGGGETLLEERKRGQTEGREGD